MRQTAAKFVPHMLSADFLCTRTRKTRPKRNFLSTVITGDEDENKVKGMMIWGYCGDSNCITGGAALHITSKGATLDRTVLTHNCGKPKIFVLSQAWNFWFTPHAKFGMWFTWDWIFQVIGWVLFNQTVVTIPLAHSSYQMMMWRGSPPLRELPAFHWALVELAVNIIMVEIGFYYAHRYLF